MDTERKKKFIIDLAYFAIILGIAILLCRYALNVLMPFFIALIVALLLKPLIRFLHTKCHIHKVIAGVVVVVLFYALIGFVLALAGVNLFTLGKRLVLALPAFYTDTIEPSVMRAFDSLERFAEKLDPSAAAAYDVVAANLTQTLEESIISLTKRIGSGVTDVAAGTPGFLLNVLITIIATVFLSVDWTILKEFVMRQFSNENQQLLRDIRKHLGLTLGRYVRSYALILGITFLELFIGLLLIGVKNAILIALLIALFDILPVVGSGLVLLPWTIVTLLQGATGRGIGLAILYVLIIVVRNIMEPKIIGNRVGLHPIVTLLSMIVGTYVFGPIGLLGLPVTLALIQSLNEAGVIQVYKRKSASAASGSGHAPAGAEDEPGETPPAPPTAPVSPDGSAGSDELGA